MKYFDQITIEISHPNDQILRSTWLSIWSFSPPYQFQSKPKIFFKVFCSGFQNLYFLKIWPNCTGNPLTDLLINSLSPINPSGQVCIVWRLKDLLKIYWGVLSKANNIAQDMIKYFVTISLPVWTYLHTIQCIVLMQT